MTYKVTIKGNRKIWLTKSLSKATDNFRATERKRKKFAENASAEIWEGERKVEEMLLNWGKEKWRNDLSIYREWNIIQMFILSDVGLEAFFFPFFFFKLSSTFSFVLTSTSKMLLAFFTNHNHFPVNLA